MIIDKNFAGIKRKENERARRFKKIEMEEVGGK